MFALCKNPHKNPTMWHVDTMHSLATCILTRNVAGNFLWPKPQFGLSICNMSKCNWLGSTAHQLFVGNYASSNLWHFQFHVSSCFIHLPKSALLAKVLLHVLQQGLLCQSCSWRHGLFVTVASWRTKSATATSKKQTWTSLGRTWLSRIAEVPTCLCFWLCFWLCYFPKRMLLFILEIHFDHGGLL